MQGALHRSPRILRSGRLLQSWLGGLELRECARDGAGAAAQPAGTLAAKGFALFATGRYEEAADYQERSIRLHRGYNLAHRVLAASYAHLGRIEEAGNALGEALRLEPGLSASKIRLELTAADPALFDHYLDGLRKAELKE